jgi:hypothetical protein
LIPGGGGHTAGPYDPVGGYAVRIDLALIDDFPSAEAVAVVSALPDRRPGRPKGGGAPHRFARGALSRYSGQ